MEGFIFGNLPLCVFLMLTSPLSRGHGSAPLLRRGDIPATPTLAKGNKLQQRSLNPCLARETRPPPARQPPCSPRSPPRCPACSDPPGPAAAGNAQERWSDPGSGSAEEKTRVPEEYTAAPQHLGTSRAASALLALSLLCIASSRRKARQWEEPCWLSHAGSRALRSSQRHSGLYNLPCISSG